MREANKTYFDKLGENLRKIRKQKGLSQHQLASKCEVDRAKISQIENGKEDFLFETLVELSKGLKVELKEILDFKIEE